MRALSVSLSTLLTLGDATGAYLAWRMSFGSKHSDIYFLRKQRKIFHYTNKTEMFLIGTTCVRTCDLISARPNWVQALLWRWNWWSTSRTTRRPGARASLWRPPCRGVRHDRYGPPAAATIIPDRPALQARAFRMLGPCQIVGSAFRLATSSRSPRPRQALNRARRQPATATGPTRTPSRWPTRPGCICVQAQRLPYGYAPGGVAWRRLAVGEAL